MNEILKKIKISRLSKNDKIFLDFYYNSTSYKYRDYVIIRSTKNKKEKLKITFTYNGMDLSISVELANKFEDYTTYYLKINIISEMLRKYTEYDINRLNFNYF